jgi:hypothetical protein
MLEKSKTLEGYSIFIGKIKELKANSFTLDPQSAFSGHLIHSLREPTPKVLMNR